MSIRPVPHNITRSRRADMLGVDSKFFGCTLWLTGLSGAGKTTLSFGVEAELVSRGIPSYGLDGDILRLGINKNLGFTPGDRTENIRRAGEVCKLFADGGIVAIASFISPFKADRRSVRRLHEEAGLRFIECHVATPLATCEARDPKGLYRKARAGIIKGFTGIDGIYEAPENPEIVVGANGESIAESVRIVVDYLTTQGIIPPAPSSLIQGGASGSATSTLYVPAEKAAEAKAEAAGLPKLAIDKPTLEWVQVLADGWAAPLKGFMREDEFLQTLHFNSLELPGGVIANQSVPIVCPATAEDKARLANAPAVTLTYNSKDIAILRSPEFFDARKEERCARQFGTTRETHPGVIQAHSQGDFFVGGSLDVLEPVLWGDGLDLYRMSPAAIREETTRRGADVVYAVQLEAPVHSGYIRVVRDVHKELLKRGFRKPLLVLHPLGGTRAVEGTEDSTSAPAPLAALVGQHEALVRADGAGLPNDSTVVALFPSPRTYGGPTEAQWHAKARLNAGIHYLVVGRDPKGLTSFGIGDGRSGVEEVLQAAPGLEGIRILKVNLGEYDLKQVQTRGGVYVAAL